MYYRRTGHAMVNPSAPRAFAVCDRCGMLYNHKSLNWQYEWTGPRLQNERMLVCNSCYDKPQEQLKLMVIPADPIPIDTPRAEDFFSDTTSTLGFVTEDGHIVISEIEDTLTPDPGNPAIYP